MQKIQLLTKIHSSKQILYKKFIKELEEAIKNLDARITSSVLDEDGFITISIEGEDEIAAKNYLSTLFGEASNFLKIKEEDKIKGYICSSGKIGFGFFVDVGIKNPYKIDVLIPLYTLRKQLINDIKLPVRKIIEVFGLVDNLPIEITIKKINVGMKKIEGELSDNQLTLFQKWREEGLERLIIIGASEEEIIRTLANTKHENDIIAKEKLGWMENALTCKFNTTAKGLIPEIGKEIPKARLEIFSPAKIKEALREFQ